MKFGIHANSETLTTDHVDSGLLDEKGRKVGTMARYKSLSYYVTPDACWSRGGMHATEELAQAEADKLATTEGFEAHTHASRDGQQFGASQSTITGTLDECKAKVAKRSAGALKRYTKKYGAK